MAAPAFTVPFDVSLSASATKTVVGLAAASGKVFTVVNIVVSFDGTDATKAPVLIELVTGTNASNPPGTNSTSVTPVQIRGRVCTTTLTAAKNWTTEPTVLTQAGAIRINPTAGMVYQLPLGREVEIDGTTTKFVGLRLTTASAVTPTATGWIEYEE